MVLEGAMNPDVGADRTLLDLGLRGPSLFARTITVFAIAAAIGLILGRTLPALLTAVFVGLVVSAVATWTATALQPTVLIAPLGDHQVVHGIVRGERYLDTDGRAYSIDEVTAMVPAGTPDATTWIETHFRVVAVGVPGTKYWEVEAFSCAGLALVTVAALGVGAVAANRRRPV
jgi:hypothetical protein